MLCVRTFNSTTELFQHKHTHMNNDERLVMSAEAARPRLELRARAAAVGGREDVRDAQLPAGSATSRSSTTWVALSAAAMPPEAPPPEEEVVSSSDATEVLAEEGIGQPVATGRSHGLLLLMERGNAARDHGQDGRRNCTWRRGTVGSSARRSCWPAAR